MTHRMVLVSVCALCLPALAFAQTPVPTTSTSTVLPQAVVPPELPKTSPDPAKPAVEPEKPAVEPVKPVEPAKNGAAAPRGTSGVKANEARLADVGAEYQIGPEDVLDISVWKNPDLSRGIVPVRPDGRISLPLINDIQAAGLTPSQLRDKLTTQLGEYVPAPEVAVIVREVHSRKVTVVGSVKTPGRFEMKSTAMTVLEAIAMSQGFGDFAQRDKIVVLRQQNGATVRLPFNYRKVAEGHEQENFLLRPGDIVVVP